MNIEKAIEILELHNKWRRDNKGKYEMVEPKELGKAIDLVVSEFKNLYLQNVVRSACVWWKDEIKRNDGDISSRYYPDVMPWNLSKEQILQMYLSEHCA